MKELILSQYSVFTSARSQYTTTEWSGASNTGTTARGFSDLPDPGRFSLRTFRAATSLLYPLRHSELGRSQWFQDQALSSKLLMSFNKFLFTDKPQ